MDIIIRGDRGTGKSSQMFKIVLERCRETPGTYADIILSTPEQAKTYKKWWPLDAEYSYTDNALRFNNGSRIYFVTSSISVMGRNPDIVADDRVVQDYVPALDQAYSRVPIRITVSNQRGG